VFSPKVKINNPFELRTRGEVLRTLKRSGCPELLTFTNSCSRTWGLPNPTPHCGYCSQCVDRRFGIIRAGLDHLEPPHRYKVDVFTERLEEGEQRTVALSYVNLARQLRTWTDQQMMDELPELAAALPADPVVADRIAGEYIQMLRRHARAVRSVMVKMQQRYAGDVFDRKVAEDSLLRFDSGSKGTEAKRFGAERAEPTPQPAGANMFRRRGDGWDVAYGGISVIVKHRVGLTYIARLLEHRSQSFRALDLQVNGQVALPDPVANGSMGAGMIGSLEPGLTVHRRSRQPTSDPRTQNEVEAEARALAEEQVRADEAGDVRRSEEIAQKISDLGRHWKKGLALSGRPRDFDDEDAQATNTVTKAIRGAIKYLARHHTSLAAHLKMSISTGSVCRYASEQSIDWDVSH
jgi:hypothetical protein